MKTRYILIGLAVIALATAILIPALSKAKVKENYGSCLLVLGRRISLVREYAVGHGHLPPADADFAALADGMLYEPEGLHITYGGSEALTLDSPARTIVVTCAHPTSEKQQYIYCALLSGEVVILPSRFGILGQQAPVGVGTILHAAPAVTAP